MPVSGYKRAMKMMDGLIKMDKDYYTLDDIKGQIFKIAGVTNVTIQQYLNLLKELGWIEEEQFKFKLNIEKFNNDIKNGGVKNE